MESPEATLERLKKYVNKRRVRLEQHPFWVLGLAALFGVVAAAIRLMYAGKTLPSHGPGLLLQGVLTVVAGVCFLVAFATFVWFIALMCKPSSSL